MRQRHPLQQTWRRFLALWDTLADPGPGGMDWDCEVVAEVVTLYSRLARAGVRFCEAFMADMDRLTQAGRFGDDNEFVGHQANSIARDQDDEDTEDDTQEEGADEYCCRFEPGERQPF